MIHVDRNSWEKVQGLNSFTDEFYQIKAEEERFVATAARTFYDAHPSLSALALCHVWQRYTQEVDRFSGDSNI